MKAVIHFLDLFQPKLIIRSSKPVCIHVYETRSVSHTPAVLLQGIRDHAACSLSIGVTTVNRPTRCTYSHMDSQAELVCVIE